MHKKYVSLFLSGIVIGAVTMFSLSSALAFFHGWDEQTGGPLTGPVKACEAAKKNYKQGIADAKAKGLSLQLPAEEVSRMVQEIKDFRKQVCQEAKEAASGLSSPVQLCKRAKADYKGNLETIKAKGLSLQIPKEDIAFQIKDLKDYRKQVCAEAAKVKKAKKK